MRTRRRSNRNVSGRAVKTALMALCATAALVALFVTVGVQRIFTPAGLLRLVLPAVSAQAPQSPPSQAQEPTDPSRPQASGGADAENSAVPRIRYELMEVERGVSQKVTIELLGISSQQIDLSGQEPKVLIYHTHTTEAYFPSAAYPYTASSKWRTTDAACNIQAVGEKLARLLEQQYGIKVIHDTTDHEPPKLGTAYTRSILTMERYHQQYPSIELFIDVHRDSFSDDYEGPESTDFLELDGQQVARLMFVVGTGEGQTGVGFSEKPNYQVNYALALNITEQLQQLHPKLARPIRVKTGRYNQHIPGRALLVEVGHNANTLDEALAAMPYLAKAIALASGMG